MKTPVELARPRRSGPLTDRLARERPGFGLPQVPATRQPTATTRLICGFCATGCGLDVHLHEGEAVGLTPSNDHPVNLGMACPKGWEALTPLAAPDRATTPLLRDDHGHLRPVDWPTALGAFVTRMRAVQREHGPESVAFLSTGQIVTEEMAFLGALAKFGMGMRHGDGNTRQCMATSVAAYKESFGFDAPPYSYADFEESDVIVLVGSNLCLTHPIMWERITRNPHDPEIVVVDPRRTETASAATLHLAPNPKSDLVLLNGIAHLVVANGWVDEAFVRDHTTGYADLVRHLSAYPPERTCAETGIDRADLERVARLIGTGARVSLWWTMGVNQSHDGTRTAQAIINLALLTGNIGRPGTGANSITGQCNAMGSRLFSNTTNLLGGHDFANPDHRAKVAGILGLDEAVIPDGPSWAYDRIIEGINRGEIRGLWIIATNSAHSWINQHEVSRLLDKLDFLVVQDLYTTTETAQHADLVLPAAGWAEKEGTFINSERRLGLVKRVARAPGQALADFWIFRAVADAWGCGEQFARWTDPEAVFGLLQELSAGQPCDLTGVRGYEEVDSAVVQWPYRVSDRIDPGDGGGASADRVDPRGPDGGGPLGPVDATDARAQRRLFADGRFFTPDGRARLVAGDPTVPLERPSAEFPLVLLTGRGSSAQWHTGTRTSKSATLRALAPDGAWVEIDPADAAERGIQGGQQVVVRSARGRMLARAHVTPTVGRGRVFVSMHDARTNRLTFAAFDPQSRQPSYKYAAVQVALPEPWDLAD